jgi:AcrR family transcriptional regulator
VLFRSPGINATGVAELAAAAQVSKRTLYQHFASKDVVVVAYLRDLEQADAGREAVLGRSDLSARARLLELFGESDGEPAPLRGDAFVNAAVELSTPEHPAHRLAVAHKRAFAERLAAIAREAGARNPERVGRRLALLYDGAAAHAAVYGTADGFAEARLLAAAVLQQTID